MKTKTITIIEEKWDYKQFLWVLPPVGFGTLSIILFPWMSGFLFGVGTTIIITIIADGKSETKKQIKVKQ